MKYALSYYAHYLCIIDFYIPMYWLLCTNYGMKIVPLKIDLDLFYLNARTLHTY